MFFLIYIPVLEPLVECLNIALNRRKDTNTDTSTLTFNDRPTTHSDTTVLLRSSHFLVFFFFFFSNLSSCPHSFLHLLLIFASPSPVLTQPANFTRACVSYYFSDCEFYLRTLCFVSQVINYHSLHRSFAPEQPEPSPFPAATVQPGDQ